MFPQSERPRVLRIDLTALAAGKPTGEVTPWHSDDRALDRVGSWSGTALALALWLDGGEAIRTSLVFAVADGVRRGVPTAERAGVSGSSPLTGLYVEGQVGGELGRRLASRADALVLSGCTGRPGSVLVVGDAGVELRAHPELCGRSPQSVARRLTALHGGVCICVGPAGEAEHPFANLAVGRDEVSFVGRGGLGARLGAMGLKAVVVATAVRVAPEDAAVDAGSAELRKLLGSSPRLLARSAGGSFEQGHALAAAGDLRGPQATLETSAGVAYAREAEETEHDRRGCRGCPTPCGWVFDRGDEGSVKGTFSGAFAVGPALGLAKFEDSLRLLECCDAAGIDSVEVGAVLGLWVQASAAGAVPEGAGAGDLDELLRCVDELAARRTGRGRELSRGAARLAVALDREAATPVCRGLAVRPAHEPARVLAQCAATSGGDPLGHFAPQLDPAVTVGAGRAFRDAEELQGAVDLSGFCAFSASALLTDGLVDLDGLARWAAPPAVSSAAAWLGAGAATVLMRRELNRRWGAGEDADRPLWARELLERTGLWEEYRTARGLDAGGAPTAETWAELGAPVAPDRVRELAAGVGSRGGRAEADAAEPTERGRVHLRAVGPLAAALAGDRELTLDLPLSMERFLLELARERPQASRYLLSADKPLAVVYRDGERLASTDRIRAGDTLDLVVAIRGG